MCPASVDEVPTSFVDTGRSGFEMGSPRMSLQAHTFFKMNYYDQTAEGYPELHREEQINKIKIIKQNINPQPAETILDLGAGTGFLNKFFPNHKITSLDPSQELLKQNQNQNKIKASAEQLPFPDHQFDWVISITAIHHFNLDQAIPEIKRVGQNNFVITVLKKANNKDLIIKKLKQNFQIKKQIDEEKDLIFILENFK